jgi:hypothetical protein
MFPNCHTPPLQKYINLKGLPNKQIFVHALSLTPHARFLRSKIDHISANSKQNSKKAFARESGALGVLFDEKTEGRKSRDTVPLNIISCSIYKIFSTSLYAVK